VGERGSKSGKLGKVSSAGGGQSPFSSGFSRGIIGGEFGIVDANELPKGRKKTEHEFRKEEVYRGTSKKRRGVVKQYGKNYAADQSLGINALH